MKARTWILIAALVALPLFAAGPAFAQEGPPRDGMHHHGFRRHGGPGHRLDMLVAILGLDAHQEATVRQIFETNRPRREAIFALSDEAARRAAFRALHDETREAIDAVLTPDQRATLDRMEAVRREHRGRDGGPRRGHRGPAPAPSAPTGI